MRLRAIALILAAAGPCSAADAFLHWPIACTLGQDCTIEAYVDRDPGPGRQDMACGLRTRDGHSGIDIALPDFGALERAVAVLAAADGVVEAVRDGVPPSQPDQRYKGNEECGNAVRLGHANGLKTLYCHMKAGSLAVEKGERVVAGQPLGEVGLSGMTNFPHLHLSVLRKDGSAVDPFAPEASESCGEAADTLWNDTPPYEQTGFLTAGFATAVPNLESVRSGEALGTSASPGDALVLYGLMALARHGDLLSFEATGPGGEIFERDEILKAPQKSVMRAFGRRAPPEGWPEGSYTGTLTLTRQRKLIGVRHAFITVGAAGE